MSVYLTINPREEIKKRITMINSVRENLMDAKAELEEVKKRDPLSKTRGSGDSTYTGNTGSERIHPGISLPKRESLLSERVAQYESIVHDFDRGWNLLSDKQKECLTERFINCRKQVEVAKSLGYSERHVKRIENEALMIMESELLKI